MREFLDVYRQLNYDGRTYAKVQTDKPVELITYSLYSGDNLVTKKSSILAGEAVCFDIPGSGSYHVSAEVAYAADDEVATFHKYFSVKPTLLRSHTKHIATDTRKLKGKAEPVAGCDRYYLEVKFKSGTYSTFNFEQEQRIPLFKKIVRKHQREVINADGKVLLPVFNQIYQKKYESGLLNDLYKLPFYASFNDLKPVAEELEKLECVEFCSIAPVAADLLPPAELFEVESETQVENRASATPDFTALQSYQSAWPGMNVRNGWNKGSAGSHATVRLLDFGVYRNHEDLVGNITVVNSRAETQDCHHGTASTGVIAAKKNSYGVTGIAHECDFNFYDTGNLDLIVRDAQPGDIVALNIQFVVNGRYLPAICNSSWWNRIKALTDNNVVVVMAAGNGSVDLSPEAGILSDLGDSGALVVGACSSTTSRRLSFSNYNHYTSLICSWGERVTTTGYGALQSGNGNVNLSYTNGYNGTSSATPLTAAALAVIQSYAKERYGVFLNTSEMRDLIAASGNSQGVNDRIGYMPDVMAAMERLDAMLDEGIPDPQPEPEPSPYPLWARNTVYVGGDRVSHLGQNYLAKWWISPNVEPGLPGTTGAASGDALPWTRI
ncbi:S8 family serine peptidase [Pantoea sp. BAV 3049]|uniref:S8 family peptidase n=1 Tax=Pantoea sp. BAV 3049 TaxID=2654188 RepID=UPI00131C25A1|nr:S8 family serine peptidase [Pantoea sp. BAV 3049]